MKIFAVLGSILMLASLSLAQEAPLEQRHRYGGPISIRRPVYPLTSALLAAGGHDKGRFLLSTALKTILGPEKAMAEMRKLNEQYGRARVTKWLEVFDFAVADAIEVLKEANVGLPSPQVSGERIASDMVGLARDKEGVVYSDTLFDILFTHSVHGRIVDDIEKKFGEREAVDLHRITNQALYDIGTGFPINRTLKLAALH